MVHQRTFTISRVISLLKKHYPDIAASKLRYLEDEGLLQPARTPKGYRVYSEEDVRRIETILHMQHDEFLPLSVIKERLDNGGASLTFSEYGESVLATTAAQKAVPINEVSELLSVDSSFITQLDDAGVIHIHKSNQGRLLINPAYYDLIRLAKQLSSYGIEPRNLRSFVNAANRKAVLIEQALATQKTTLLATSEPQDAQAQLAQREKEISQVMTSIENKLLFNSLQQIQKEEHV